MRLSLAQLTRLHARSAAELQPAEDTLRAALARAEKDDKKDGLSGSETTVAVQRELAMLLCQAGRDEEAQGLLSLAKCSYRLSPEVLCYKESEVALNSDHSTQLDSTLTQLTLLLTFSSSSCSTVLNCTQLYSTPPALLNPPQPSPVVMLAGVVFEQDVRRGGRGSPAAHAATPTNRLCTRISVNRSLLAQFRENTE